MFHKIRNLEVLENFVIRVSFNEGIIKTYDIKPLFGKIEIFNELKNDDLFQKAYVAPDGHAVIWNDHIDISSDELFNNGQI